MQVLIPAAGMGNRLGAYTKDKTKCMVEVNGKTLIERALNILKEYSISRFVIVVGYEKDKLISFLGDSFEGIPIKYIHNDIYDKTNNIYSIYLAKDELMKEDTILLESDLIFEKSLVDALVENQYPNLALVDKYQRWMDGTVVKIDSQYDICSFISGRNFDFSDAENYYKTVNIYKFSKEFLRTKYIPFLDAYSKALGNNEYYEQVLKVITLLDTKDLKALPLNGQKWYEIDDAQDLDNAEVIFASDEKKSKLLAKRYGGYWRFEDVVDFCYLVNPYFPTQKFIEEMKYSFEPLLRDYPSGSDTQSLLAAKLFNCAQDQVVVGNGAAELLPLLAKEIGEKKLGLFLPTFEEYSGRFKNVITKNIENESFSYSADDIIEYAHELDGFILINPDNPSGNYIRYTELVRLVSWFESHDKLLIVDESFVDFSDEGIASSLIDVDFLSGTKNLIVIKSIGKTYGVPGARLGVLASNNKAIVSNIKKSLPVWNINSFGEYFLQIIGKYKSDYELSCEKIKKERALLAEQLNSFNSLRVIESQANYILCEVIGLSSEVLVRTLSHRYDLLVKDCSHKLGFLGRSYVRIAVKDSYDNQVLLHALSNILKD